MHATADADDLPVPGALEHFDPNSGSRLERLVFNNRRAVIVAVRGAHACCSACWSRYAG